ncbi:hypothetical protein F4810DRAFT_708367 [Camillea tinctor]|nr:hypothetical protein F4810DRAFT_708367 [Camillea tinctor]
MAGTSPTRRSSRARTTQSQSHHSSATSSSSGRAERSTRAFTKTGSPQKSTGSGSLSSEPPDDSATASTNNDDTILRRRSTRGKEDDRDKQPKIELLDMAPASDEVQEDDEAVRCICGHDEYPGPPPFDEDSKHGIKDAIDHERIFAIEITDEMAGFFVQCEICNTWQHGACVGFTTEESNPDDLEYFCEQCRKDLHKIYTASNGQKYSIFLPIHRPSRAASRATSAAKDGARSPKSNGGGRNSRSSAAAHTSKRRSTMNSRDAAYYEEEQIRRAIEASKEDAIPEEQEPARRTKRGRDDSEEYVSDADNLAAASNPLHRKPESIKRQRTNSKSPSPVVEKPQSINQDESDDESTLRNGSSKKSRNAARNQREKAERDERREEQERKRAEAASKRKGRAERRRADDSDPSEEMPLAARATATHRATESAQPPEPPQPSSQPPPDTPPAPPAPTTSHKKKSTAHSKKKGRNQYTKDRDNHDHDDSPARSVSRDTGRNADENGTSHHHTKASGHEGGTTKHTKAKGGMNSRITMSDMKRRANGILEYISRTQVELASEPFSQTKSKNNQGNGSGVSLPQIKLNGNNSNNTIKIHDAIPTTNGATTTIPADPTLLMKEFRDLSCVEMMDALTRDLMKWQQEFAP